MKKEGKFDNYYLETQQHHRGTLYSIVRFSRVEKDLGISSLTYEITSPNGIKYPMKGFACGLAKGGYCVTFTVDSKQIHREEKRISCRYDFRIDNTSFILTSGFIRNGAHGREWRADEECLKLEIRKE